MMVRNIDLSKEAQRGNAEAAGLPFFACNSNAKAAAEHGDAGEDSGSDGILLVEEIEEAKKEIHPLKNSVLGDTNEPPPVEANWSVFEQMGRLGELANGCVYEVEALKTPILSSEHEGRVELNNPELLKKHGSKKQGLGLNMHSFVGKASKTRIIMTDEAYVIK